MFFKKSLGVSGVGDQNFSSGKKFPKTKTLDVVGDKLLSGQFESFTHQFTGNNPLKVHFFAKYDDVVGFLAPRPAGQSSEDVWPADNVSLENYDDALDNGAYRTRFFITGDDENVKLHWKVLEAAFRLSPALYRRTDADFLDQPFDLIREQAELAVNEAIQNIHTHNKKPRPLKQLYYWFKGERRPTEFNAVRDYGFVVTHIFIRDFLGVKMPKRRSILFWALKLARNPAQWGVIKSRGLSGTANEFFLWIGTMFANLFINPGGRNKFYTFLSKYIAKKYKKEILKSYKDPSKGSLLDRLKTVETSAKDWPDYQKYSPEEFTKHYQDRVVDIIMELAGSFQYLTGSAFSAMLPAMENWYKDHGSGMGAEAGREDCQPSEPISMIDGFVSRLNQDMETADNKTPNFIDEALRHYTPTRFIFRKAKKNFTHKDAQIEKGDLICLLTDKVMKDPDIFGPSPDQFLKSTDVKKHAGHYFTFGSPDQLTKDVTRQQPIPGHHPCFGQHWARIILRTMFNGLTQFKNIRVPNPEGLKTHQEMPDRYTMAYDAPIETHSFVTIISEFNGADVGGETAEQFIGKPPRQWVEHLSANHPELQEELQAYLDQYDAKDCEADDGGERTSFIQQSLGACAQLHFMSAHIIRGNNDAEGEPDYLMLEMSVDGSAEDFIEDLGGKFGYELLGLYSALGIVKTASLPGLKSTIYDQAVELQQSIWPTLLTNKSANGLPFCGSGGLSVARIKSEANIANWIDEELRDMGDVARHNTHQAKLFALREKLFSVDSLKNDRWVLGGSSAPQFAETANDDWNQNTDSAELSMGDGVKFGLKLFPRILLLPAFLLFIISAAIMDAVLSPGGLTAGQYTHFPTQVLPSGVIDPGLWISAQNVLGYVFLAVMIGGLIGMIFRKFRTGSMGRMGDLSLASIIFCALIYWPTFFNNFIAIDSAKEGSFFTPYKSDFLTSGSTLPIALTILLSLLGILFMAIRDRAAKVPTYQKSISKLFALFSMLMLIGALLHVHIKLILTKDGIVNRFLDASIFDLIFYPMGWAAIVTITLHAFRHSYTRHKVQLFGKLNLMVFFATAAFVFVCAFFPSRPNCAAAVCEPTNFIHLGRDVLIYILIIPLLASTAILSTLRALDPSINFPMISKPYLRSPILGWTIALSVIFNFTPFPRLWLQSKQEGIDWAFLKRDTGSVDLEAYRDVISDKFLAFLAALPISIIVIGILAAGLYKLLRTAEIANTPSDSGTPHRQIENIMENENTDNLDEDQLQNHMVSVQRLVPNWFRMRVLLPLSFHVIRRMLTTGIIRPGFLGNVGTVHYARWVHLPKTRNYVFFSNYDGSWESYLEDFITKVSTGVNAAWSHCIGFPKVENLFFKGVEDGDRFKRWARGSMRPTPFWYSAYPDISAEMIRRNALIRDGVVRARTASDAEAWIDLFGSVTRPEQALQTDQIQNMVFGGAGHLDSGGCLIISRPKNSKKGSQDIVAKNLRKLLQQLQPHLNFGQAKPDGQAAYVALAPEGLRVLDVKDILQGPDKWQGNEPPKSSLDPDGFSPAFTLGMQHMSRKALLKDPQKMDWGNEPDNDVVLASLFLYARDEYSYERLKDSIFDDVTCEVREIRFQPSTDESGARREPFGFVDGVSNPILRGSKKAVSNPNSIHLLNPGEIVLGYKDNRGYYPPSPQVYAKDDPHRILPALASLQPSKYPTFATSDAKDIRDLGRNGSYLVIRELEQDVAAFKDCTFDMAKTLMKDLDDDGTDIDKMINAKKVQKIIQAKMVGRWQDGTSLVRRPISLADIARGNIELPEPDDNPIAAANAKNDNEYLFGRDDPQGHACPFGSHVRRSFPRDSLNPKDPRDLDVANRHRILRRGRAYIDEDGKQGTFFVCLNADLDRQFEFIQQSWVMGRNFHGLKNEYDPLAAGSPKGFTIQAPGKDKYFGCTKANMEECLEDEKQDSGYNRLQQFVTLKGGGYFFLPSKDALSFLLSLPRA